MPEANRSQLVTCRHPKFVPLGATIGGRGGGHGSYSCASRRSGQKGARAVFTTGAPKSPGLLPRDAQKSQILSFSCQRQIRTDRRPSELEHIPLFGRTCTLGACMVHTSLGKRNTSRRPAQGSHPYWDSPKGQVTCGVRDCGSYNVLPSLFSQFLKALRHSHTPLLTRKGRPWDSHFARSPSPFRGVHPQGARCRVSAVQRH